MRETWGFAPCSEMCENACDTKAPDCYMGKEGCFVYKANYGKTEDDSFPPSMFKWRPSIHMPKEAARAWLKVTDVRVERLQNITNEQILKEGANTEAIKHYIKQMPQKSEDWIHVAHVIEFQQLWDSTIEKADIDKYGWEADPWVWVIEFERCEKPKGEKT